MVHDAAPPVTLLWSKRRGCWRGRLCSASRATVATIAYCNKGHDWRVMCEPPQGGAFVRVGYADSVAQGKGMAARWLRNLHGDAL